LHIYPDGKACKPLVCIMLAWVRQAYQAYHPSWLDKEGTTSDDGLDA